MSEPLRMPWGGDDSSRREVAPSTFRPRRSRGKGEPARVHASRVPKRREGEWSRPPAASRAAATASAAVRPASPVTSHASRETTRGRASGGVVLGPQRERHDPDYVLLAAAVALSAIGILMVFSSRGVREAVNGGSIFDGVITQLGWAIVGGVVLMLVTRTDYRLWRHVSVLGFGVAVAFLVLLFVDLPPLIEPLEVRGATRWLRIGGLPYFHPAELAKLAMVVYLAHWLARRETDVTSFRRGMVPFVVIVGLVAGLVMLEPDLGTSGVIVLTGFAMFFVAGGSILQLLLIVPVGVAAVVLMILRNPYQVERWTTFLDPFSAAADEGFQTVQGLYALAFGGLFGQGLGQTRQPSGLTLPAAENDFIFAVVGQEFGLLGGLTVVGLFLLLAWRGIRVAMRAPDPFGRLLALGLTAWLAFQAFINIGVVVNLVPLTGMPLPFLSDGGTSLVVVLAAVGILLSISRETTASTVSSHADPHRGRGHRRPHLPRLGRGVAAGGAAG